MTLSIVPQRVEPAPSPAPLPTFEGESVHSFRAKLMPTANLEMGEEAHRIDDYVQLVVCARVVRVDHVVDARSGRLVRVETFKAIEATELLFSADLAGKE